jgi:hypothetical protein
MSFRAIVCLSKHVSGNTAWSSPDCWSAAAAAALFFVAFHRSR